MFVGPSPPLPTPRFIPLLIRCRYTCADDDVSRRHRHRCLVPKMSNRKKSSHCWPRDARKRINVSRPFSARFSPFFFAIAPEGKYAFPVWLVYWRVHLIPGGSPSDICSPTSDIPFPLSRRHEIKEGEVFSVANIYTHLCMLPSRVRREYCLGLLSRKSMLRGSPGLLARAPRNGLRK